MLFQAPPPPPPPPVPPPAERVLRQETGTVVVTDNDRQLVIQKPPVAEAVVVRQRLLLRHTLTELAIGEGDGPTTCRWEITGYMQRDLCFTSVTGLTGCTASVSDRLAPEAAGTFETTPPPPEGAPPPDRPPKRCAFNAALLAANLADASARLAERSAELFEKDFAVHVRPMLTKSGATLRAR